MITDDLPWPELGNVSRGATRGNQGSKGVLGPPDEDGRAILQLRVQPGVLAVKLNPTAAAWYRMLDNEVQRALKETKTYWRKARRRQDYDARADQDHMELHEWLQQLKDKAMAHLELLLQKGEITGPPYVMPDNLEFTFMRGFVERQRSGVPHNPRLRGLPRDEQHHIPPEDLDDEDPDARGSPESVGSPLKSPVSGLTAGRPGPSSSPTWTKGPPDASPFIDLIHRIEAAQNALRQSRSRLRAARSASQDALARYKQSTDQEHVLEAEVIRAEERLDELIHSYVQQQQPASASGPSTSRPVAGPSIELQIHTQAHTRPQPHGPGQVQPPSTASTPIATSAPPNEAFDQERGIAAMRPMLPTSHSHSHQQMQQQQSQQQQQQHTPYHQTNVYSWMAPPFHGPPQRPASVSSAPGGLSIELAGGQRFDADLSFGPGSAGGSRSGESWTTGSGVGGEGEAAMMHAVSRVASPQRKHPREWDASATTQHEPHPSQQMTGLRDSGERDAGPHPPRKRMQPSSSGGPTNLPLALTLTSPHTPLPSPHTPQVHQTQQQHAPHVYPPWTNFTPGPGPDSGHT